MSTSAFTSRPTTLSFYLLLLVCCALLSVPYAHAKSPEFQFDDKARTLTISTDRFELDWRDGSMVRLVTLLPKREELTTFPRTMTVDQVPSGLGSFYLQTEAGRRQHQPLGGGRIPISFPAQHPPNGSSRVSYKTVQNGVELTYQGLQGEGQAVLVQELTVEGETGDLVIRQKGSTKNPGVFGLSFGVLNLKPDLSLIIPFFAGEKWDATQSVGMIQSFAWPRFWSAALIIMETPGGGTFSVWAQDGSMRPKYLHYYNSGDLLGFAFESCEEAPYEQRTSANACEWRFNTFPGNWTQAAARYKEWMVRGYGITPRTQRTAKWVNDIAIFWPNDDFSLVTLNAMAKLLDPKHVLIHDWGMLPGFNRRVPEYIPRDKNYAKKTAFAKMKGFHVGGYSSMLLADIETHPEILEKFGLELIYDGLSGDKPKKPESWLVGVHPGSSKWRDFYTDKMKTLHEGYGLSLLYQDMSGASYGSAGTVEGRGLAASVVACEEAIRKHLPQVALMGEYWNEVNASREDFALNNYLDWFGEDYRKRLIKTVHPILSFLFSDFCLRMSYSRPLREKDRFHLEEKINEITGAVPYWNTPVNDTSGEALLTLERAKLWAAGFRPYFPERWEPNVVAFMKNHEGEIVRYVAKGESTYCYRGKGESEKLVYARVTGESLLNLPGPVRIEPWIAYDEKGPIGMDPDQWYCVLPGEPGSIPFQITELPSSATIQGARVTDDFVIVELGGTGSGIVRWRSSRPLVQLSRTAALAPASGGVAWVDLPSSLVLSRKSPGLKAPVIRPASPSTSLMSSQPNQQKIKTQPMILPLENWKASVVSHGWIVGGANVIREPVKLCDGRLLEAYRVLPPVGGQDVEISIDGLVRISDSGSPMLKAVLRLMSDCPGDGVNFVIRVNGREIWRKPKTGSHYESISVALSPFSGQDVILSLAVDCGPGGHSTSCDDSQWIDVRLEDLPRFP